MFRSVLRVRSALQATRAASRTAASAWMRTVSAAAVHTMARGAVAAPVRVAAWKAPMYASVAMRRFCATPQAMEGMEHVAHIRNLAVIAHVDHGKTSLIDELLQASDDGSGVSAGERVMDSHDLEKERGITVLSKATSLRWTHGGEEYHINVLDTPGHADFGGEVERVLQMVDSVLLLVDAHEGPKPQTKFVLRKALQHGLRPIVVLNKCDRPSTRCDEVESELFDLFVSLDATDEQLDFPIIYASAKEGWATLSMAAENAREQGMAPVLETIVKHVPPAAAAPSEPFSMLVSIMESDTHLGRIVTGRIHSGAVKAGDRVVALDVDGSKVDEGRVLRVMARRGGMARVNLDVGEAGDIISVSGLAGAGVTHTVCAPEWTTPHKATPIDPPTIAMTFGCNTSPLKGSEGTRMNSGQIRERLERESETNVAITVKAAGTDTYEVCGRGELQLGILAEEMRREGFEMSVSPPRVLMRTDDNGKKLEPAEHVEVEVDQEYSGKVMEMLNTRKAELKEFSPMEGDKTKLVFTCPSRALIGFRSEFHSVTRGTGILTSAFDSYVPFRGALDSVRKGVLISSAGGATTAYALAAIEPRGTLFVGPGEKCYPGMIVGEHAKGNDLEVNAVRAKATSNIRTVNKDDAIKLTTPRKMTLEEAIAYVQPGELLEVTPENVRMRKAILDSTARKADARKSRK